MSITIIGGNDGMVKNYKNLCEQYKCKVKVFTQPCTKMRKQLGATDLLILFTNTVSHKMVKSALASSCCESANIVRSHSSSMASLKEILDKHVV
ncbi:MAG: DUF2325 domain-containing protein [Lachnospiraceae bacterium]